MMMEVPAETLGETLGATQKSSGGHGRDAARVGAARVDATRVDATLTKRARVGLPVEVGRQRVLLGRRLAEPAVNEIARRVQDNDCLNGPDDAEVTYCQCTVAQATRSCNTSQPGICAVGIETCVFAADNTVSNYSSCVAPVAKARDCRSTIDNNCNGSPDNVELECGGCSGNAPACTLAEDGVGTCRAGTPIRTYSADASTCRWDCSGRQEPTGQEICGPLTPDNKPTPDVGCDGIAGNGASCGLIKVHLYRGQSNSLSCGCTSAGSYTYANYIATTGASPGSGWTEVTQFMVFPPSIGPLLGTIAVLNCTEASNKYVTIGSPRSGCVEVGYVSKTQATGYVPLKQFAVSVSTCSSQRTEYAPAGQTASGVTLTASAYYAVPIPNAP